MSWTEDVDWQQRQDAKAQAEQTAAAARRALAEQQRPLLQRVAADVALLPEGFKRSGRPAQQWAGAGMFGKPIITGWTCGWMNSNTIPHKSDTVIATEDGELLIRRTTGHKKDTVRADAVRKAAALEAAKILLGVTDQPWQETSCNYLEDRDGDIIHITQSEPFDTDVPPTLEVSVREKLLSIVNQTPCATRIIRLGEPGHYTG